MNIYSKGYPNQQIYLMVRFLTSSYSVVKFNIKKNAEDLGLFLIFHVGTFTCCECLGQSFLTTV